MKILILILFPFLLSAQSLLMLMDGRITYNGSELITNSIDRDMELGSLLYTSDFSAGVDGWSAVGTEVTLAGNIDGVYGRDNVLRFNVGTNYNTSHRSLKPFGQNVANFYVLAFDYYIPTGNDSVNQFAPFTSAFAAPINAYNTKGAWTTGKRGYIEDCTATGNSVTSLFRFNALATSYTADSVYIASVSIHQAPSYYRAGNHTCDTSTAYKNGGSYSLKLVASALGNGTTNTITFGSAKFTAVTDGSNYRFQLYAYTTTANTTLTFKLGDIVKTAIVSTVGMGVINFDFKATASTTGNILIYLDKAATVYIDDVSLKSGS